MAFLNKEYKYQGSENFSSFLKAIGVPEAEIKQAENYHPVQKMVKNADGTYSIFNTFNGKSKETRFTPGVEFDDVIGVDSVPIKSLFTIDGNVVTQVSRQGDRSATFTKVYDGDNLTVTLTTAGLDGVAKRFYKA